MRRKKNLKMVKSTKKFFIIKAVKRILTQKSINVDSMGKFKSFETVIVAFLFICQNMS